MITWNGRIKVTREQPKNRITSITKFSFDKNAKTIQREKRIFVSTNSVATIGHPDTEKCTLL